MKARVVSVLTLTALVLVFTAGVQGDEVGTAFTYQGRLLDGGIPADGPYDLEFTLYDDATTGSVVAGPLAFDDYPVANSLFTVTLGFGGDVFTGEARWLEIGVRPWDSAGAYTYLAPRQELTPTAYALALPGLWTQQNVTSPNVIGGHADNSVTAGVYGATIGGGGPTNRVTDHNGTVGGGDNNVAGDNDVDPANVQGTTIAGGSNNTANGWLATIGGGFHNTAGDRATIGGGEENVATGHLSTVGGGYDNEASGEWAMVGGGIGNTASNAVATVGGGGGNTADGDGASVGGGADNTASGLKATVPGGRFNLALGSYSLAAGYRAKANHAGAFVWADSTDADFASTADNQFLIRAAGGVGIGTTSPAYRLHVVGQVASTGLIADYDTPATDTWGIRWYAGDGALARDDYYYMDINSEYLRIVQNLNEAGETTIWTIDGSGNAWISGTMTSGSSITVEGDVLARGLDGWSVPGDEAYLYLGSDAHYIKAVRGSGVRIGTWEVPDAVAIQESTGRVGIGMTTPSAKLHIGGTPGVDGIMFPDGTLQFTASGGGGGDISGSGTADYIAKFTATNAIGNSALYQDGYFVGIRTTEPKGELHVVGGTGVGGSHPSPKIVIQAPHAPAGDQTVALLVGGDTGEFGICRMNDSGSQLARTDFMIDPDSGNVGIGTADPGLMRLKVMTSDGWAGYFDNDSTLGGGAIQAQAQATSGTTYGGWFENASTTGRALRAWATATSGDNYGIYAATESDDGYAGFFEAPEVAIRAESVEGRAVDAVTTTANQWVSAIYGRNEGAGDGVYGWSQNRHGTVGVSESSTHAGVYGVNNVGGYAGVFDGWVKTDVLEIVGGSDLSEKFDVTPGVGEPQPGMVVCIDPQHPGNLVVSTKPYDRTVAGIISGAGGVKPGMLMGQTGTTADGAVSVALTGRVYCQADATGGAIQPGDLLTTSDTPGHAMKVTDPARAQGAILGKAMTGLTKGKGLVLVLANLQ